MPANLTTREDGTVEMAYVGATPWHGLGKSVDHIMKAAECLEFAQLGWTVEKVGIRTFEGVEVVGRYATVRRDTRKALGIVGERYTIVQNVDAFTFMDAVTETGEAKYHTAGSLGGGTMIWLLAKLPESVAVADKDLIDQYILLSNSHNGWSALTVKWTPVRVVCQNTLTAALSGGKRGIRHSHTLSITGKVKSTRELLGLGRSYFAGFGEEAQRLADKRVTEGMLTGLFGSLYAIDPKRMEMVLAGDKAVAKERAAQEITELYHAGANNQIAGIGGSAWALYNGVTEYVTHGRPVRGEGVAAAERAFFRTNLGSDMQDLRQKAWDYLVAAK